MRVGVIGVGSMGINHPRTYLEFGAELVGIADTNQENLEKASALYKVPTYLDYKDLLECELDAVSIVVPTTLHKIVALDVIDKGINLLIEKPIADSLQNATDIIEKAKAHNVKLMVGHIERFNPVVSKLKQIIDEGVLGKLICISAKRVGPFVPRISDVGIIIDIATHDIDIIRYLIGSECTSAYSKSTRYKNLKGDAALLLISFGEISASIEVNWYTPFKTRNITVTGTEGVAYADYIKQEMKIYHADWEMTPKINKAEPLTLELEHFLDCIRLDKEPLVSGYDGLKVLEIAINSQK